MDLWGWDSKEILFKLLMAARQGLEREHLHPL